MIYTITIVAENKPGVLNRVTGLLTRRKINIMRLDAHETEKPEISHITINAHVDPHIIDTLVKQIDRIIEVTAITYATARH